MRQHLSKVTASSVILAATTSASFVFYVKKGAVSTSQLAHIPSTSSSSQKASFTVENLLIPSMTSQSNVLFSSLTDLSRRSIRPLQSSFFDGPFFRSPSVPGSINDMVKTLRNRFNVGDYYVWLYKDASNQPTSWEKYTVTDVHDNGTVVIDMSTKFSDKDEFTTHHRMRVNLADNLKAVDCKDNWKLCGFEYKDCDDDGEDDAVETANWKQFGTGENVQAFEEKFDVFNMLRHHQGVTITEKKNRTVKMNGTGLRLIRTNRHGYTDAWYAPLEHGELSGVALLKEFKEHSFSLIESGINGSDPKLVNVNSEDYK